MQSSSIRSFLLLINIIFIIHVSAIFHPTFSDRHYYTSSDWPGIIYSSSDSSIIYHHLGRKLSHRTITVCHLFLTTTLCDGSRFVDYDCSAARPYRCIWRARKRRPHMHATSERSTTQTRLPRRRWSTSRLTKHR